MRPTTQGNFETGSVPDKSHPGENQTEWQRKVLYHHRTRTALGNERKYFGWMTLGCVVLIAVLLWFPGVGHVSP